MPVFIAVWVVIIGFVVGWYVVAKIKQNKETKPIKSLSESTNLLKDIKVSLGCFGFFDNRKIKLENLQEYCENPENKAEFYNIFNEFKTLIESHSQYITNYFMSVPFETGIDENWDDWIFGKDKNNYSEEQLAELRSGVEQKLLAEMGEYLEKETTKDIAELYKKYLPYFDYDKFVKTIELEYLHINADDFSIQLSDKNMTLFCAAYENFDKDLNGFDWHNF